MRYLFMFMLPLMFLASCGPTVQEIVQQQEAVRQQQSAHDEYLIDKANTLCKSKGLKIGSTVFAECSTRIYQTLVQRDSDTLQAQRAAQYQSDEQARRVAAAMAAYGQWDRDRVQQPIRSQCSTWAGGMNCNTYGR